MWRRKLTFITKSTAKEKRKHLSWRCKSSRRKNLSTVYAQTSWCKKFVFHRHFVTGTVKSIAFFYVRVHRYVNELLFVHEYRDITGYGVTYMQSTTLKFPWNYHHSVFCVLFLWTTSQQSINLPLSRNRGSNGCKCMWERPVQKNCCADLCVCVFLKHIQ